MIETDIDMGKVIAPKHYQSPFTQNRVDCDFFVDLLPFWLGNAFKYVWRAGRKEGSNVRLDLNKAMESMRKWNMIQEAWHYETYMHKYQGVLLDFFCTLFDQVDLTPLEMARKNALEAILIGDTFMANSSIERMLDICEASQK